MKKAEQRRIDAFELWCWKRLLRVPWTARRSNQSLLKEISPEYQLEVQFSSVVQSCLTLCSPMDHITPGLPVHHQLPEFAPTHCIESVMPFNHLILCQSLYLLPSIFPSIRVFPMSQFFTLSKQSTRVSALASVSASSEYSGLISFRSDWFDLLAVQATLKSLLQHHSSEASLLWRSAFFMIQILHPCMTAGKNHSLDHTDLCWQSKVSAF